MIKVDIKPDGTVRDVPISEGSYSNGFALTKSELEDFARSVWKWHWGKVFMKDTGGDFDEHPESQDCEDVFQEHWQQKLKEME